MTRLRLFADIASYGALPAVVDEKGVTHSFADFCRLADDIVAPLGAEPLLLRLEMTNALMPLAAYVGALRAGHAVIVSGEGSTDDDRVGVRFLPHATYRRNGNTWLFAKTGKPHVKLHPDLAVLLSTSGSTGDPKLVRLSHDNLISNARSIAEYLDIQPADRAVTSLPPSYSYGLSVLNSHWLTGASIALTDLSVADAAFWDVFEQVGGTSFAGVPHSFALLERAKHLDRALPHLRYFTQAGGKLSPEKVALFANHAAARDRKFCVMYGQTEASPRMAYLPADIAADQPQSIGIAIPGGRLELHDEDGRLIEADGIEGELVYRGPNVMLGYAFEAADLAKGRETDALKTGDLARRDANGLFTIVGRASRFVKLYGLRISLDDVEAYLTQAGVEGAATGDDSGLAIMVLGTPDTAADIRAQIQKRFKLTPDVVEVGAGDALPRHASGKLNYPAIKTQVRAVTPVEAVASLRAALAQVLNPQIGRNTKQAPLADDATFVSLGGDSLSYVQASTIIDAHLGYLPDDWERTPIRELERKTKVEGRKSSTLDSSVFVRALAILVVVLDHAWADAAGGAGVALMLVAGLNFSRFQVPKILNRQSLMLLWSTFWRVMLPYFAFVSVTLFHHRKIFLPQYLLYSNFTKGVFDNEGNKLLVPYWFIEDYLFYVLFFTVLLSMPFIGRMLKANAWRFACGLFAAVFAIALIGDFNRTFPAFYGFTPLSVGWIFTLGWLLHQAHTQVQKHLAFWAGSIAILIMSPYSVDFPSFLQKLNQLSVEIFLLKTTISVAIQIGTVWLLLYGRGIAMSSRVAAVFSVAAAASFYIYMSHPFVLHYVGHKGELPPALLAVVVSAIVGIGIWQASNIAEKVLSLGVRIFAKHTLPAS